MNILEFRKLKLDDPVLDSTGKLVKVFDIDWNRMTVKTSKFGGAWRSFRDVRLPGKEKKKKEC